MHLQIRSSTTASPPDLVKFLQVLKDAKINLLGVGGGNVEVQGEFVCAPDDKGAQAALNALRAAGYKQARLLNAHDGDFTIVHVANEVGALHDALLGVAAANLTKGKVILDVVSLHAQDPAHPGLIPVQVYSVDAKSPHTA